MWLEYYDSYVVRLVPLKFLEISEISVSKKVSDPWKLLSQQTETFVTTNGNFCHNKRKLFSQQTETFFTTGGNFFHNKRKLFSQQTETFFTTGGNFFHNEWRVFNPLFFMKNNLIRNRNYSYVTNQKEILVHLTIIRMRVGVQ